MDLEIPNKVSITIIISIVILILSIIGFKHHSDMMFIKNGYSQQIYKAEYPNGNSPSYIKIWVKPVKVDTVVMVNTVEIKE